MKILSPFPIKINVKGAYILIRFLLYLLVFISFMDLFAQLPITSTYAQNLHAATGFIGFIVGAYSLSNLFSNVLSGIFVDKNGPKKVMLAGFLVNGIILALYAVVTSPVQLLVVRLLNGITAGVITPAVFTYISLNDRSKKSRGQEMAYSGAAVGLAAISGPAISGILSSLYNHETVYVILAILMLIGAGFTLLLKPVKETSEQPTQKEQVKIANYLPLFKTKGLIIGFTGAFSLAASQGVLAYMLPLKVRALEMETHISGMLMSIFGIVAIIFFVLPTNRVFDRGRNEIILAIGLLLSAISQTLNGLFSTLPLLILSMSLYGLGFSFIFPSMSSLIAKYSPGNMRGKAFGLFYGFFSIGSFLGSSVTGMFSLTPNQGFVSIAVFLIIISVTIIVAARKPAQEMAQS